MPISRCHHRYPRRHRAGAAERPSQVFVSAADGAAPTALAPLTHLNAGPSITRTSREADPKPAPLGVGMTTLTGLRPIALAQANPETYAPLRLLETPSPRL